MTTHRIEYQHGDKVMEAYAAYPNDQTNPLPTLVLLHAWHGRDELVCQTADRYAAQGYVSVALDNYGKGVVGGSAEESSRLMMPLMENRKLLAERLVIGIQTVQKLSYVDPQKMVVIGYCFGGLCALDLLRNHVELAGVISVHGLFGAPNYPLQYYPKTKVLVLTGYNDPMVPVEQANMLSKELDTAKADWQMVTYGNTMHGFTNPNANDPVRGIVYNPVAAKRSEGVIEQFIQECVK